MENEKNYPPKVKAMYEAVLELFASGRELSTLKVSEITAKAGIGKGTAYEYFSTKEEMIVGAIRYEAAKHVAVIIELIENGESFQEIIFQGMDMLEATNEKYGGFDLLEKILRDTSITGSGLMDELKKYKEDCGAVRSLSQKLLGLATDKGLIQETNTYKVWGAIFSQFVSYAFYLTHQELLMGAEREEVRNIIYENIIKLLN
ncbi:MAG: TetR/AcrR family transcriptional regulator [Lachnospiraceae bacterium]|nr:TetR/AcrR family transcriptional regulator [Lachnospiraceae bacterium]